MFTTNGHFNGLSYAIYRNGILQSQLKTLAKIQLSVICAYVVAFHRPTHICGAHSGLPQLSDSNVQHMATM